MPSIYELKPKFQALLRPLCRGLAGLGVTANAVTLAALILSLAYGAALYWSSADHFLLLGLPALLLVRMAMNALDGMMAREFGQKSDLGAFLNELSDVLADAALYLPFAMITGISATLVIGVVTIGVIAEMAGVVAVMIGAQRRYDGPFGKSDRAFFFAVVAILVGLGVNPGGWGDLVFAAALLLGLLTMTNRVRAALKEARHG